MPVTTFNDLISALNRFTSIFANNGLYNGTPVTTTVLGQEVTIERIQGFIVPILPQLFIFIGVVIAIRIVLKLFKKFSR